MKAEIFLTSGGPFHFATSLCVEAILPCALSVLALGLLAANHPNRSVCCGLGRPTRRLSETPLAFIPLRRSYGGQVGEGERAYGSIGLGRRRSIREVGLVDLAPSTGPRRKLETAPASRSAKLLDTRTGRSV